VVAELAGAEVGRPTCRLGLTETIALAVVAVDRTVARQSGAAMIPLESRIPRNPGLWSVRSRCSRTSKTGAAWWLGREGLGGFAQLRDRDLQLAVGGV
jgi:hypothetical protein